jgi:hypothetical protein
VPADHYAQAPEMVHAGIRQIAEEVARAYDERG